MRWQVLPLDLPHYLAQHTARSLDLLHYLAQHTARSLDLPHYLAIAETGMYM